MTIKAWKRTVQAARAEEQSAWTMILAYADEAFEKDETYKNATAGRQIEQLRLELEAAGITMGFDTLKDRATTGVHVHKASAKDRATLTSVGWTIISKLAHAGYSPEASAHAIRECRGAGQTPTYRWAKDFVRESALPGGGSTGSAKFTDTKLLKAVTDVAAHHQAAQAGQWAPSAMSRLALQLLGEMISGERTVVDWDNELRDLIAAEDGG